MILFIKHIDIEGPETIGGFLKNAGYYYEVVNLDQGDAFPDLNEEIDAVISLGGPMNVYEVDKYSFLEAEDDFIRAVLECEVPFLGICLGSQLLAKACGAHVTKAPQREMGFMPIHITNEGKEDVLFQGVDNGLQVFQWHEDMFEVPDGGQLLAKSDSCPQQAFRMGPNAYGLQFHIEITQKSIFDWSERYFDLSQKKNRVAMEAMATDYYRKKEAFQSQAYLIYNNFVKILKKSKGKRKFHLGV